MQIIKILILFTLLTIFVQDLKCRAVNWVLFPVLCSLLVWLSGMENNGLRGLVRSMPFNYGFLVLQLLLLSLYFALKNKRWTNITTSLLGWGDILFLLCPGVYLSGAEFLAFYILSLVIILILLPVWQILPGKKMTTIPLAGLQAFLFGLLLCAEWWLNVFKFPDSGLFNLVIR